MKPILPPTNILSDGDMSGDLESAVQPIPYIDDVGIQCIWEGDAVGVLAIQGCLDYNAQVPDDAHWVTVLTANVSGVDGVWLADMDLLSFPWIRVIYTSTSGTGTLKVLVTGKMI